MGERERKKEGEGKKEARKEGKKEGGNAIVFLFIAVQH